ncbi:MAG: hypothetical protein QM535_10130 [Limnohabitans sp.]|nr:hypothetical protein [Limnohabitans sp.]
MKKLVFFTILLLSNVSKTIACGYSPEGEDIRYSLFLPKYFNYQDFNAFNYNSQSFGFDFVDDNEYASNVYDWYQFTKEKVSLESISKCLNEFTVNDISASSKNEFLQYLYKNKLQNVIDYLITAKKCEEINTFDSEDEWERETESKNVNTSNFLIRLKKKIEAEKSDYIKRKYAFLIIRYAYYSGNFDIIQDFFNTYFKNGQRDYLYYWSLYFNCFKSHNEVDIANVMANSVEKKYAAYHYFYYDFNLKKALTLIKTKEDIANVYAYASLQKQDPSLEYLKMIYQNSNKSRILSFLLLREINKIEDWVYTPYYTNYLPSIEFLDNWYDDEMKYSTNSLRKRSEDDRLYALQVLNFVNSVDLRKVENPVLWKSAQIQLLFMTKKYDECLNKIRTFEKEYAKDKSFEQIERLKAICITANQSFGNAIVKEEIRPIILKYKKDKLFLFTVGRELEFRGNLSQGIALISLNSSGDNWEYYKSWRGNRLKTSGNLKYFYDYFDYLDFVYGANELQVVVNDLNPKKFDDFETELYSQLIKDKNYLTDLLGTKYLRENRLAESEKTFKSIEEKYWYQNYNAWERDKYDEYYGFEENPFYDFKHTENFIPHTEKYFVNKLSVVEHLNKYLKLANSPNQKDKDYYCFLIANCYYNMTQYGHSWMMRRFESTYASYKPGRNDSYVDELEYRNCDLAIKYYKLAYDNAKTEKFKALCIKFLSKLEHSRLYNLNEKTDKMSYEDYSNMILSKNKYYQLFTNKYSEYEGDLSSCNDLDEYFKARR